MTADARIRIGGASGYWGDAALATPQLLATGNLDYIVYDYLAEVTMSIMARARAADPQKGYATDFVSAAMRPNLRQIADQGVKVLANAGGVNPRACAEALRALISEQGLALKVAVVLGDDLADRAGEFVGATEMFSGEAFPDPSRVASINAYLGAFPIAAALDAGADIVVTGRCVDSAVTLGACIHAFQWQSEDFDQLAQGSLAGHILECGTQATGGNFTDWESIVDTLGSAGYPIAELSSNGSFTVSKPEGSGGLVSVGTVGEQMLYEIGDPSAYFLPDVVCDFSQVELSQLGPDLVNVSGARGRGAPSSYKVSSTWSDGFRAGQIWTMIGRAAPQKARHLAESIFARTELVLAEAGLEPLQETSVEVLGVESHFGAAVRYFRSREVDVKIAVKHASPKGVGIFLKEMVGLALTAPPGLASFAGARPKPTPVVRLFSMLIPKDQLNIVVEVDGETIVTPQQLPGDSIASLQPIAVPKPDSSLDDSVSVPLELLAFGRSGDKGDKANIGVMARHPDFLPWIAAALSPEKLATYFEHFLKPGQPAPVERFYLPGTHALNFLLHDVLGGGGVASLRADPQGKAYAQLLLTERVSIPRELAERHRLAIPE
ncbi:acyclic terpene utilization AtuA family protein [Congregibacter brevis]|uniref:Acyclic terpene utilization AtuA family protein n=1 Tax=Congregibacter brevis TaxID=3081201 RepID=A0ABZ0IFI5_9GAMM|nr:acyclic terpene utilization AtuA family protein [Congregibacter sp. IMCC45268]